MSDNITLHKSDCALLLGGYQCTCGLYQRNSKTLPALAAEQPVAKAWAEGYQQGVKDERTSEASIGIAGFGAKVEPARQNPYRTALAAEQPKPITVPKTVPLPPITCGFVDVRFDGEGWFCDKCGKRMSADFEASVRRGSGEKCYLELMQRKSEAIRTMSERNMK